MAQSKRNRRGTVGDHLDLVEVLGHGQLLVPLRVQEAEI